MCACDLGTPPAAQARRIVGHSNFRCVWIVAITLKRRVVGCGSAILLLSLLQIDTIITRLGNGQQSVSDRLFPLSPYFHVSDKFGFCSDSVPSLDIFLLLFCFI